MNDYQEMLLEKIANSLGVLEYLAYSIIFGLIGFAIYSVGNWVYELIIY